MEGFSIRANECVLKYREAGSSNTFKNVKL